MKRQKRALGILLVMVMMASLFTAMPVKAAGANVTIALSSSSLKVGDTLTVTVSVKCSEAIGSYSMAVTYDSSVIEYSSGSGNGGGGTVNIAGYGDGSATTLKATLQFKAVGNGSTSITTTGGEAYTWNEEEMAISHAGAKITVAAAASASTDTTLSALSVSPGTLSPAFSPSTTSYTVSVGADTADLVVSATANDSKASVSVSGNKGLKAGENTIKVTVKAESGDTKTYKIICTKAGGTTSTEATTEAVTEEPTENTEDTSETTEAPEEQITVLIDGVTYTFAQSAEGLNVPEEFTETASVYQDQEILAFSGPGEAILLVCLFDAQGNQAWFMYDETTGGFLSYSEMNTAGSRLFILKAGDDVEVPEDYRSVEMDLNGTVIPGFMNESNSEIILVYARKLTGEEGLYYFDTIENGFIRYIPEEVTTEEPTEEMVPVMAEPDLGNDGDIPYDMMKLLTVVSSVLALLLLFSGAVLLGKNISLKKKLGKSGESDIMTGSEEMVSADVEKASVEPKKSGQVKGNASERLGRLTDAEGNDLEEKAAALVAKLSLDEEQKTEQTTVSKDTAPVPIIKLEDDEK